MSMNICYLKFKDSFETGNTPVCCPADFRVRQVPFPRTGIGQSLKYLPIQGPFRSCAQHI